MSLHNQVKDRIKILSECYDVEDGLAKLPLYGDMPTMYRFDYEGRGDYEVILPKLEAIFGEPSLICEDAADKTFYHEYSDDHSWVRFYFNIKKTTSDGKNVQVRGVTTSVIIKERISEFSELINTTQDPNSVFALMSGHGGLSLRSLGKINHNIVTSNYYQESIDGYNHILGCYASDSPCGRLALLQGPPGTGKSYMIRSLISNVNSLFIVVASHMISDLSGPAILPVLMGCVNPEDKKPITFILEDSDIALSHRKNGGVAELSGLLNLGDGLLGEMLDIRIIATTNAELLDLDPAITRPGRMCQHINLRPFDPVRADRLYQSMTGKPARFKKPTTLAEIYRMAREDGWKPNVKETSKGQYL